MSRTLTLTRLDTIKMLPVLWLWQGRLPRAMFGLLAGREGQGKSLILAWLTALVTRGKLPGDDHGRPRKVIICATEDSFAHTIVPRLVAAGADLTMVARIDVKDGDHDSELNLPVDIPQLIEQATVNDVALIILDPLTSRLHTKLDTHKDADVRRALEPIVDLAEQTDAAVVGVIHFNKSMANTDLNNLIMGSRAFAAVARFILGVVQDPEDETGATLILGQSKNSVGPCLALPLMPYSIESALVPNDDGTEIPTAKIRWHQEDQTRTFHEVSRPPSQKKDRARDDAARWLREYLEGREGRKAPPHEIKRAAEAAGHAARTIDRAADELGLVRQGGGRTTTWALPEPKLPMEVPF